MWSLRVRMCWEKDFCRIRWSEWVCPVLWMRYFWWSLQSQSVGTLFFYLRGSWLTIRAHPMPWLGLPTALWLQAVTGGLWPTERKAMCSKRLTIAGTLRSESLPPLPRVPGASLLCWEAMTGRSPFQLHLLPTSPTLCHGPVFLNQSGRLDHNQMHVERDSQVLIYAFPLLLLPKCTCSVVSLYFP